MYDLVYWLTTTRVLSVHGSDPIYLPLILSCGMTVEWLYTDNRPVYV